MMVLCTLFLLMVLALQGCADPGANAARITAECPALKAGASVVGMASPAVGIPVGLATGIACANPERLGEGEAWVSGKAKAALGR